VALPVAIVGETPVTAAEDAALDFGPDWVRVCAPGSEPDAARVAGTGLAEVSVAVDGFAEWILASCAIDPVFFPAHAALRALRQPA
jgi:hypothetical protein